MMMGAPAFALVGYAAASLVIPRGFALPLSGLARAMSYQWVIARLPAMSYRWVMRQIFLIPAVACRSRWGGAV